MTNRSRIDVHLVVGLLSCCAVTATGIDFHRWLATHRFLCLSRARVVPNQSVQGSSRKHSITAFLSKACCVCFVRRLENHGWWHLTLFGRPHLKSLQRRHPSGWVHRCAYVCDLFFSPLGVGLSPASSCSASRQLCAAESSHARFSASRQPWTAATACKGHRSRNTLAAQRQQAVFEAAFLSLEDGSYSHLLPVVPGRRATQVTSLTTGSVAWLQLAVSQPHFVMLCRASAKGTAALSMLVLLRQLTTQ